MVALMVDSKAALMVADLVEMLDCLSVAYLVVWMAVQRVVM